MSKKQLSFKWDSLAQPIYNWVIDSRVHLVWVIGQPDPTCFSFLFLIYSLFFMYIYILVTHNYIFAKI